MMVNLCKMGEKIEDSHKTVITDAMDIFGYSEKEQNAVISELDSPEITPIAIKDIRRMTDDDRKYVLKQGLKILESSISTKQENYLEFITRAFGLTQTDFEKNSRSNQRRFLRSRVNLLVDTVSQPNGLGFIFTNGEVIEKSFDRRTESRLVLASIAEVLKKNKTSNFRNLKFDGKCWSWFLYWYKGWFEYRANFCTSSTRQSMSSLY